MHARSTSITGETAAIDECVTYVRDVVMPGVTRMDGCMGMSLLVDRDSGRCIATTSWSSKDAMRSTEGRVSALRDVASEIMGGEVAVDEWEIALMHREHDAQEGSWCRVTWLGCETSEVDSTIDRFRDEVLPRLEEDDGFCSASFLVDRASGRCCATARFETRASLDATREMVKGMREDMSRTAGTEFTDVAECELVIAQLSVPELV